MIFVTVGTHEQQFNRLVEYMDKWAAQNEEEIINSCFIAYFRYECIWRKYGSFGR